MPISPWLASPGWTKKAGVPVLASVAADVARLAHAQHHHPSATGQQMAGGRDKGAVDARNEVGDRARLGLKDCPGELAELVGFGGIHVVKEPVCAMSEGRDTHANAWLTTRLRHRPQAAQKRWIAAGWARAVFDRITLSSASRGPY